MNWSDVGAARTSFRSARTMARQSGGPSRRSHPTLFIGLAKRSSRTEKHGNCAGSFAHGGCVKLVGRVFTTRIAAVTAHKSAAVRLAGIARIRNSELLLQSAIERSIGRR